MPLTTGQTIMNKLSELLKARAAKFDELEKLVEKMGAADYAETAEDNKLYDELKSAVADLDGKVARFQSLQAMKGAAAVVVPGQERRNDDGPRIHRVRNSALKNITGADAEERAHGFGQFALASIWGSAKAAAWCRENGIVIEKAASESVNSAGGVLVPTEYSTMIIDLRDSYGIARRLCQVMPMGRDTLSIPRRTGGLTAYAVGEGSTLTQSQMTWDNVMLVAKKWAVLTALSSELDEDAAVNIGDILAGEIAYAFAQSEDNALFIGDGSSTYHGMRGLRTLFNTGVGSLAGSVDAASNHDTFEEIDATDLSRVMAKLPQYVYQKGQPRWYVSQVGWASVFERLRVAAGGATMESVGGKVQRTYLGYPVEIVPVMPTSTGDLSDVAMILFGDIAMATTMGNRRELRLERSTEYLFATDQIAIKGTERFDMVVHDIGTTSAAGPIVALMGE